MAKPKILDEINNLSEAKADKTVVETNFTEVENNFSNVFDRFSQVELTAGKNITIQDNKINGEDGYRAGDIIFTKESSLGEDYLLANGAKVYRADYPELFTAPFAPPAR